MKPAYYILTLIIISIVIIGCINYDSEPYGGRQDSLPKKCPDIRVLLATADSVTISSASGARKLETDNSDISAMFPMASITWKIELRDGKWVINGRPINSFSSTLKLPAGFASATSRITAINDNVTRIDGSYRGDIQLLARPYGKIAIVNSVKLEYYLCSVVGSEVYANWHSDALRAQAIAARSYAIWRMNENSRKLWDIGSDQASQCYNGVSSEHDRINKAVNECAGLVLTYTSASGRMVILPAFYSAVCGGSTESGGKTFGYGLPQLPEKVCPYCKTSAPAKQYRWDSVALSRTYVNSKLAARFGLSDIRDIVVTEKNSFGRIRYLNLIDKSGKVARIKADEFRLTLNSPETKILSTWFDISANSTKTGWVISNGKGWGHGVGLCQRGAQQMALEGGNDIRILSFYYPQAIVKKAY